MRTHPLVFALLLAACSKSGSTSPPTSPAPPDSPAPGEAATADGERPGLTAAACEEQGGTVVGDIGDGAIHRPDYRCESGEPPIGSITTEPGGPIAVEGAVCCA